MSLMRSDRVFDGGHAHYRRDATRLQQMQQTLVLDQALISRYDQSGPRYTSYPTAVQFHDGFGPEDYRAAAQRSNASGRPLSLYFHIPFCDTVCFYCACNKIATKDRTRAQPYLDRVYREIEMQAELFDRNRPVEQLHWGGGTPTFISAAQMRELMAVTGRHFKLLDDDSGEYSIEIDPREVTDETIGLLREIGFNRMSLGLQDLDPTCSKGGQPYPNRRADLRRPRCGTSRRLPLDQHGSDLRSAAADCRSLSSLRWIA